MELFRLSRRSCIFLVLFLIVNPIPGLLARGEAKPRPENGGNYRWQSRGCKAVFNAIYNNVKIEKGVLLVAVGPINVIVNPGDKELDEVFNRIVEFVRANPDKVVSMTALLASACLLYDSILLTREIGRFFDRFEELRGQFDTFRERELPKIELNEIDEFPREIISLLDKVCDLIEEANVAKWDAQFTAEVSFVFAAAAGVAASPIVPIASPFIIGGVAVVAFLSAGAGVLSLKNVGDCKLALEKLRGFKEKMEGLESEVRAGFNARKENELIKL